MTVVLFLGAALVIGARIRSRWVFLLPAGVGACVALAMVATGHSLADTPIPFLVVVCTLVIAGCQGLRSAHRHG